jgi:hypothetical protein
MPHTISSTAAEQTASQSTLTGTGSPQRAAMLALEKKSLAAGYNRASSQPSTTTTQASLSDPLLAVVDEDLISSLGSLSQFNGLVSPPAGLMIRAEEVAWCSFRIGSWVFSPVLLDPRHACWFEANAQNPRCEQSRLSAF